MIETQRITVEGLSTSVLVGGSDAADEAVVFVHGNPDTGSDWMPLMIRVAEFARVIAPDLPGFGAADPRRDSDYSVSSYGRFVHGVIEHYGIRRVHVVGHDFGGPFAASWAADHPDRVASVTFLNTGVLVGYTWHRMARLWQTPVVGELMMAASTRRVSEKMLARDNPGLALPWVEEIVGHLLPAKTRRAVLRLYRSVRPGEMALLAARLHQHDHDALVVFGDADAYIPVEQAYRQRDVFPRAEIHLLPGIGHWCWLERTDDVADRLIPFLNARLSH